jgi:hypothetical protein
MTDRPKFTSEQLASPLTVEHISAIAKGFAPAIREYLAKEIAPLVERVKILEHREAAADKRLNDCEQRNWMGVWDEHRSYSRGAACTLAGSLWVVESDMAVAGERPGASKVWRLAVKRGRMEREHTIA